MIRIIFCCLALCALAADETPTATIPSAPNTECYPRYIGACPHFPIGGDGAVAFDSFRSLPEGSWAGNNGGFISLNLGFGIPKEIYGFGGQLGGSYGLYNWNGNGSSSSAGTKAIEQQGFVTAGLFRMTPYCSGLNVGLVYDLMLNRNLGVFALNPILGQLRPQIGYLIFGSNEVGLLAAINTQTAHKEASELPVSFRAIGQVSVFWSHYFENRGQMMLWLGLPYAKGLMYSSGRVGTFLFGSSVKAPLSNSWSAFGHGSFMGAHSGSASQTSSTYAFNVTFGFNYSFGGCKANQRPYLDLANNSNFLVDTNLTQ